MTLAEGAKSFGLESTMQYFFTRKAKHGLLTLRIFPAFLTREKCTNTEEMLKPKKMARLQQTCGISQSSTPWQKSIWDIPHRNLFRSLSVLWRRVATKVMSYSMHFVVAAQHL